ncbi:hypothetical protein [Nocardia arthritidis]|uniref:Uncharacterized protein n=1 Tax=Nocardia arthritidis TaxID=228602 RepID=A0A6G9Y575_9NOCA|nr:hypothetical protein [Nocardia arthritidis]QIS08237.1 hypothetical protein F5544_01575 [Nocardia arthritidis]
MNYDHLLLPSGAASTLAEVDAYLATQQGVPETETVATLAAQLNKANAELPEANAFLSAEVGGAATGAVLHVACPYDAIGHVRRILFALATPLGYAVYDPQLAWLIDPAGSVAVTVTHGGAGEFPYLTKTLAEQWVSELTPPNPYLIVERAPHDYIQTYLDKSGVYTLEYRDGAPDRHFGVTIRDAAMVAELIWDWTAGDRSRLNSMPWSRLDL